MRIAEAPLQRGFKRGPTLLLRGGLPGSLLCSRFIHLGRSILSILFWPQYADMLIKVVKEQVLVIGCESKWSGRKELSVLCGLSFN